MSRSSAYRIDTGTFTASLWFDWDLAYMYMYIPHSRIVNKAVCGRVWMHNVAHALMQYTMSARYRVSLGWMPL